MLKRSASTISREMARNRGQRGYRPKQAHSLSVTRRAMNARMIDDVTWQFMQEKLLQQWSPEQISGHVAISHEAVYQRIYADKRAGGMPWQQLRCQKQHRKHHGKRIVAPYQAKKLTRFAACCQAAKIGFLIHQ